MSAEQIDKKKEAKEFYLHIKKMASTYKIKLRYITDMLGVSVTTPSSCKRGIYHAPAGWREKLAQIEISLKVIADQERDQKSERAKANKVRNSLIVWSQKEVDGFLLLLVSREGKIEVLAPGDFLYADALKQV